MKNSVVRCSCARKRLVMAALAISAAACAAHDTEGDLSDPKVRAKLHDLGLQASAAASVPSPRTMYAVAVSDHQAAETVLSGAIINDHAPVFVIVMTGGPFTAGRAPAEVDPPEGSVLTVTVNAATYEGTDSGISDVEPDLSQIASATVALIAP